MSLDIFVLTNVKRRDKLVLNSDPYLRLLVQTCNDISGWADDGL